MGILDQRPCDTCGHPVQYRAGEGGGDHRKCSCTGCTQEICDAFGRWGSDAKLLSPSLLGTKWSEGEALVTFVHLKAVSLDVMLGLYIHEVKCPGPVGIYTHFL